MDNLIVIKQLPIIEEQLKNLSNDVDIMVTNAKSLVCNEDTVKSVKDTRANLNKTFKDLETRRKDVKSQILAPYEQFEAVYKECISDKFKTADVELKAKIDEVEDGLKAEKEKEVKDYFNEYLQSKNIDFITYENANINVTLSASIKGLKEQAKTFIDRISDDLSLIETQEFKAEIMVEYKKFLNVSNAITTVVNRHKAIEIELEKSVEVAEIKAVEAEIVKRVEYNTPPALNSPEVIELPLIVCFKVTAIKSKLQELKQFLNNGGYKYE